MNALTVRGHSIRIQDNLFSLTDLYAIAGKPKRYTVHRFLISADASSITHDLLDADHNVVLRKVTAEGLFVHARLLQAYADHMDTGLALDVERALAAYARQSEPTVTFYIDGLKGEQLTFRQVLTPENLETFIQRFLPDFALVKRADLHNSLMQAMTDLSQLASRFSSLDEAMKRIGGAV